MRRTASAKAGRGGDSDSGVAPAPPRGRQTLEGAIDDPVKMSRASSRFCGVMARCPASCHAAKERLEHLVNDTGPDAAIHHLRSGLFLELQHVLRKNLTGNRDRSRSR